MTERQMLEIPVDADYVLDRLYRMIPGIRGYRAPRLLGLDLVEYEDCRLCGGQFNFDLPTRWQGLCMKCSNRVQDHIRQHSDHYAAVATEMKSSYDVRRAH